MSHKKIYCFLLFFLVFLPVSVPLHAAEDSGIANLRYTSKAFAFVAKQVSPSVVFIQVESVQSGAPFTPFQSPFGDDLFKRFFGERFPGFPNQQQRQPERRVMGQGSGFIFKTSW